MRFEGMREATIDHYSHFLRSFEAYVCRIECPTLGALSAPVLSPLVGDAIVDYLKRGRPRSADRQLFLRHLAPQQPLTYAAVSGE